MKYLCLVAALLLCAPAQGQACATRTGNNASVFINTMALSELSPDEHLYAFGASGCVGETATVPMDGAQALAMTVWGDDEITSEVDGLVAGEPIVLSRLQPAEHYALDMANPFRQQFTYSPNALYHVFELAFDTTTVRLIDSLNAGLATLQASLDSMSAHADSVIEIQAQEIADLNQVVATQSAQITSLQQANANLQAQVSSLTAERDQLQADLAAEVARADSLQAQIDAFPDVSQLEADLAAAQARVTELENDLATTNAQLTAIVGLLNDIIAVVNTNVNKYKDIVDVLSGQ